MSQYSQADFCEELQHGLGQESEGRMRFDIIYTQVPLAHLIHCETSYTDMSLQSYLITAASVTTEMILISSLLLASIRPA
jgi:hypothetical protein